MNSNLTISEFRNRLTTNTKIGNPELQFSLGIFSIFFLSSKCFYGKFDDSTFRLVVNYNFGHSFFILKGKYQNSGKKIKLHYTINPIIKIGIIWIQFILIVALIGFNSIFYFNIKNTPSKVYIIFNLFMIFATLYIKWRLVNERKKLEKKIIEIFEVSL